jgi:hypothetical protein
MLELTSGLERSSDDVTDTESGDERYYVEINEQIYPYLSREYMEENADMYSVPFKSLLINNINLNSEYQNKNIFIVKIEILYLFLFLILLPRVMFYF